MLNRVWNLVWTNWKQFQTSAIAGLIPRYAKQPIPTSWAEWIRSYEAVPEVYKGFFILSGEQEFPYTILTPSFEGFLHPTTEKLLCDFGHQINVLERKGDGFEATCYPLEGICCVEVRMILLDSSIKICGLTNEGVASSSTLRFNSITDYLFKPILQRLRDAKIDPKAAVQSSELEKFEPLRGKNFKFMNYAKRSLLPGEKVLHLIFQPEIQKTVFKFLGQPYKRAISPTLASILTDRELILIREEKLRRGKAKYGGIWDYLPLHKIKTLTLREIEGDLLELSVQLSEGYQHVYLFQSSAMQEIRQLQYQFQKLVIT